jgi:PIN domain nuclease of toxin-antitoxin system
MQNGFILDACALIAYFKHEEGWEVVGELIEKAACGEAHLAMSKFNLLEVYYGFYAGNGRDIAGEILQDIVQLPIQIVEDLSGAV